MHILNTLSPDTRILAFKIGLGVSFAVGVAVGLQVGIQVGQSLGKPEVLNLPIIEGTAVDIL